MIANLEAVSNGIEKINEYLNLHLKMVAAARVQSPSATSNSTSDFDNLLAAIRTQIRDISTFTYSATIVTLYGLLERHVETLVTDYVSSIAKIVPRFEDLPEEIKDNHLKLTVEVLNNLKHSRYEGKTSATELVAKLHGCLTGQKSIELNSISFAHHTANFRSDVISYLFLRVGVNLANLARNPVLVSAMETHFPVEGNRFYVLDDLAVRRNEIAHGSPSELLSIELLQSYAHVILAYFTALVTEVNSSAIELAVKFHGKELGKPNAVFMKTIAGYESVARKLEVGDVIALVSGKGGSRTCGVIKSIHVEKLSAVKCYKGSSVGLDVGVALSPRQRLFLLPRRFRYLSRVADFQTAI